MTTLTPADADRLKQAFQQCRDMEGTLSEQLQAYAAAGREIFPAYGEAVDRLVARINENGGGENAPRPGEAMPPFLLPDETGRLVSLQSLLEQGAGRGDVLSRPLVSVLPVEVRAVIQAQDRIEALGAQTVAIMPEVQAFTEKFKSEAGAPFPVLTDLDNGYALSLNLAIWLGTEIQRLLSYQDMANFHGNDGWMLPIPATFVVGRDGLVKARFVDPDFRKRMEIDDLIAALRSASEAGLAFTRRHQAPAALPMNCCQSAPRSMRITAEPPRFVRARRRRKDARCGARPALRRWRACRVGGIDAVSRHHGDADIGFEQFDQVAFRRDFMAAIDVEPVFAKRGLHPLGVLAIVPRQQLLGAKILEVDLLARRQRMLPVDDELKVLGEQRPGVEPVPFLADFGGDAEFGFAFLEEFADLAGVAAQETEFQPVELPLDLVEMRNQKRQVDRMGQRDPQRADFAALERGGELAGAGRGLVALLEQRMHALAEFGQLRGGPFAAKQVAAELGLELLDRPRQRRLRDVALVGGAREVEHARDGEEVANLMHLHGRAPICRAGKIPDPAPR